MERALAEFDESIKRIARDQPTMWVGINNHYHQRDGEAEGAALLASAEVHRRWQAANTNPAVTVLDTITANRKHYPLTVRSDHFHSGGLAGYLDALAIVRTLCAHDGIRLPEAVEKHIDTIVAGAARSPGCS